MSGRELVEEMDTYLEGHMDFSFEDLLFEDTPGGAGLMPAPLAQPNEGLGVENEPAEVPQADADFDILEWLNEDACS